MKTNMRQNRTKQVRTPAAHARFERQTAYQSAGRYYSTSSAAPKLDFEEQPVRRQRKKPATRKVLETNALHKATLILSLAVFFACGVFITLSYANLKNSQEGLLRANNELKQLQTRNETLRAEISESVNLEQVEQIAMNRLGMLEPEKYQVVNISVPRSSYTVVGNAYAQEDNGNMLKDMVGLIRGVFDGKN